MTTPIRPFERKPLLRQDSALNTPTALPQPSAASVPPERKPQQKRRRQSKSQVLWDGAPIQATSVAHFDTPDVKPARKVQADTPKAPEPTVMSPNTAWLNQSAAYWLAQGRVVIWQQDAAGRLIGFSVVAAGRGEVARVSIEQG